MNHRVIPDRSKPKYKAMLKRVKKAVKHFEALEAPSRDDLDYLQNILKTAEDEIWDLKRAAIWNREQ